MKWRLDPEIHQARIISVKDPENQGRCRIRVIGTHPSKMPEDELPWATVKPGLGGNGGQGKKEILQKGMFVSVESLTKGNSEWRITGGSITKVKDSEKKESKGPKSTRKGIEKEGHSEEFSKDAKNDKLTADSIPKTASTIMKKLKEVVTLQKIIKNLISKTIGTGGQTPVEPKDGYAIVTYNLDLSDPIVPVTGLDIDISDCVWNDENGHEVKAKKDEVVITLIDEGENKVPGDIRNKNRKEIYLQSDNRTITVPDSFIFETYKDQTFSPAYKDIIIGVELTKIKDPRIKLKTKIIIRISNSSSNAQAMPSVLPEPDRDFEVYDPNNPNHKRKKTTRAAKNVKEETEISIQEPEPDTEKGQSWNKSAEELPNGIIIEKDGSDDNSLYQIMHPSGSRVQMNNQGQVTIKGANKVMILSTGNTQVYSQGNIELGSDSIIKIVAPNVNFEGDLFVKGDIKTSGTIHAKGDISTEAGNAPTLATHKHITKKLQSGPSDITSEVPKP